MSTPLTEVWAPVVHFEGIYDVSADGQVMRVRYLNGATPGRILKHNVNPHGYHLVRLYRGHGVSTAQWAFVHRLVAAAFLGPGPDGYQVNHVDGHKSNNAVDNLEYVTPRQNILHAERLGLRPKRRGEAHHAARLTTADVIEIRSLARETRINQRTIAARFNITESHAHRIIHRRAWRHVEDGQ